MMIRVLFVCIHNSARSQMAEAFVNRLGAKQFSAQSAGLTPGTLNPIVVDVMNEAGIDIVANRTKSVDDFIKSKERFDYVITVCDEASAERCPSFPGESRRLHWSFTDPSAFEGSTEEKRSKTRIVRDQIKSKVQHWIQSLTNQGFDQ